MQRSSETIGAIAAALAKAQAELTNPEKSLIATIRASNPRDQDQTFRYAALSSGLDLVRKALGGQEIATVQTTAIDTEAGLIRLTTTLAHSSGEWLSSEWPVCPIAETAAPRRMGAALTYARRYALFTLVGIAGEDDLDARDLSAKTEAAPPFEQATPEGSVPSQPSKVPERGPGASPTHGRGEKAVRPARPTLDAQQSAALREQLIADVGRLQSADDAAEWVRRNLPLKNTLLAADADLLEENFRDRLSAIKFGLSDARTRITGGAGCRHLRIARDPLFRPQGKYKQIADRLARGGRWRAASRQGEDHSSARQGALQVRRHSALPRLRSKPDRSPSSPLCSTSRAWPKGK